MKGNSFIYFTRKTYIYKIFRGFKLFYMRTDNKLNLNQGKKQNMKKIIKIYNLGMKKLLRALKEFKVFSSVMLLNFFKNILTLKCFNIMGHS